MFTSDQLAESLRFLQEQAASAKDPAHAEYWRTATITLADATMKARNIELGQRKDDLGLLKKVA